MFPILALDTAQKRASACLIFDSHQWNGMEGANDLPHSQAVQALCDDLLAKHGFAWRDIAMFAVGCGPGSFTGLRVGSAFMAGINAPLALPMLAISSLAVTACQADADDVYVYVLEDAYADEVFVGAYLNGEERIPASCILWKDLALDAAHCVVSQHDVSQRLQGRYAQAALLYPRYHGLARAVLAQLSTMNSTEISALPKSIQPLYLQATQAEKGAANHG